MNQPCVFTFPSFWTSLAPLIPPPRAAQSAQLSSLCCRAAPHRLAASHLGGYSRQRCFLDSASLPVPAVSTPFSHVCLYSYSANRSHQYHLSRFHILALIYDICFSLSDWLRFVWQTLGSSTPLQMTPFLWLRTLLFYLTKAQSVKLENIK